MVNGNDFKEALKDAVRLLRSVKGLQKTASVPLIATTLRARPRQVYRWLGENPGSPHDLEGRYNDLKKFIDSIKTPEPPSSMVPSIQNNGSFHFQLSVSKDTIKISQDEKGNILITGPFSLKLI